MKKSKPLLLAIVLCLTIGSNFANADFNGLPDSSQTPGAFNSAVTQSTIHSTICVSGYTTTIRPKPNYTTDLKIKQLDSGYNVGGDTKKGDYEEDHLVPLEIGGNPSSPLNLWPELWNGSVGAHIKDKLENRVHALICNGTITLAAGRAIFVTNWEAGYTKWIGALPVTGSTPIPDGIPAESTPIPTVEPTYSTPTPTPLATVSSTPTPSQPSTNVPLIVTPGAFCSDSNAIGVSKTGVTYTCKTSATDSRARWRK